MAITKIPAAGFTGNNFRNIIINGDMSIAQRNTSVTGITTTDYYTVDRWRTINTNMGTWTQSQSTDVPSGQGFANSLKMDCTVADASPSAGDVIIIQQLIEGQNLQYLKKGTANAESLTVSFWVKSSKTGNYIAELRDLDNTRTISSTYTIDTADTWEKKTITFAGDTSGAFDNDNNASSRLNFWLGAGTNFTSGTLATSWQSFDNADRAVGQVNLADSTANEFYITGVQLEAGTTASDFEFLPFDVNLERCLRYFERYDENTVSDAAMPQGFSPVDVSNRPETNLIYSRKRASPTISGSGGEWQHSGDVNIAITGGPNTYIGTGLYGANLFYFVASGVSVGTFSGIGQININGSGNFINIDAEL